MSKKKGLVCYTDVRDVIHIDNQILVVLVMATFYCLLDTMQVCHTYTYVPRFEINRNSMHSANLLKQEQDIIQR